MSNADDNMIVDFSGSRRSANLIKDKASRTDYQDIDLASGYPKHLIWTTKDHRRIPIPHLEDSHLLNIIAFLRRRTEEYRKIAIGQIASGIAQNALALNLFDMWDRNEEAFQEHITSLKEGGHRIFNLEGEELLREFFPIYSHLLQEAYRRKILIEVDNTKLQHGDSHA
jgi:hypothetical protein